METSLNEVLTEERSASYFALVVVIALFGSLGRLRSYREEVVVVGDGHNGLQKAHQSLVDKLFDASLSSLR